MIHFFDENLNLVDEIGKFLIIGDAVLKIIEDCTPCSRPSQIVNKPNFALEFKGTGGVRCQVIRGGIIQNQMEVFLALSSVQQNEN